MRYATVDEWKAAFDVACIEIFPTVVNFTTLLTEWENYLPELWHLYEWNYLGNELTLYLAPEHELVNINVRRNNEMGIINI